VRRSLPGRYELDDDRDRVDAAAVHAFLSAESYWAQGRDRATVDRLIAESTRVVGLYHEGRQVGFARVVSDRVSFAWLADVYVLAGHRGRGLGVALVRETVEGSSFPEVRWLLGTRDAHELYAKVGFGKPSKRMMVRPSVRDVAADGTSPWL
jgi:GNAT superfamily N-acetyltransferase